MSQLKKDDTIFHDVNITGIVDFARVHEPKAKYGKEGTKSLEHKEYTVLLRLDNPNTLAQYNNILTRFGFSDKVFNPKTKQDVDRARQRLDKKTGTLGPLSIQFSRGAANKDGELRELLVADRYGEDLPKTTLIGNGSKAKIKLLITVDKETGAAKSMLLNGLQVIELSKPSGPKFDAIEDDVISNDTPF